MSSRESLTDTLIYMVTGFARTQELNSAVKLGIADVLASGPKHSNELAQVVIPIRRHFIDSLENWLCTTYSPRKMTEVFDSYPWAIFYASIILTHIAP
jgi:hypothetical protein